MAVEEREMSSKSATETVDTPNNKKPKYIYAALILLSFMLISSVGVTMALYMFSQEQSQKIQEIQSNQSPLLDEHIENLERMQSHVTSLVRGVEASMDMMQKTQQQTASKFDVIEKETQDLAQRIDIQKITEVKVDAENRDVFKILFKQLAQTTMLGDVDSFLRAFPEYQQEVQAYAVLLKGEKPLIITDISTAFYSVKTQGVPHKHNLLSVDEQQMSWIDYIVRFLAQFVHISKEDAGYETWHIAMSTVEDLLLEEKYEDVLEKLNTSPLVSDGRLDDMRQITATYIAQRALWFQAVDAILMKQQDKQ